MEVTCVLIPDSALADPVEAAELTERLLRGLEGIGAAVESERAGEAYFVLDGLCGLYEGERDGVLAAARAAAGREARIGIGRTRFGAWLVAGEWRSPAPVSTLIGWIGLPQRAARGLVETLERLGVSTLEVLAALPADRVADRFGPAGLRALGLARGEDSTLRPRHPHEELAAEVELPEGVAGAQLERALELLVDRLLAAPRRRGRTVLGVRLGALLSGGGSWSVEQGLGRPTASARTLRTVLAPRLETLPGPVAALRLRALGLGPRAGEQLELSLRGEEHRRRRLGEAIRELRSAQGAESLLEVLPLDSASRLPERWAVLTPGADR
jgi:protein ImuB